MLSSLINQRINLSRSTKAELAHQTSMRWIGDILVVRRNVVPRNDSKTVKASDMELERLRKTLDAVAHSNKHNSSEAMMDPEEAMESLKKAFRSVEDDELEDRRIRDIESALRSIERETAYHENRKRTNIERVLASVEEHTKKAMAPVTRSSLSNKAQKDATLASLPFNTLQTKGKGGRTITLHTVVGNKRVFIPKGWMFCTVLPPRCYSANVKKRQIKKRQAPLNG